MTSEPPRKLRRLGGPLEIPDVMGCIAAYAPRLRLVSRAAYLDPAVALHVVLAAPAAFDSLPAALRGDEAVAFAALLQRGELARFVCEPALSAERVAWALAAHRAVADGADAPAASEELCRRAVALHGGAVLLCPAARVDRELALAAVRRTPAVYAALFTRRRGCLRRFGLDPAIARAAVQASGTNILHLPQERWTLELARVALERWPRGDGRRPPLAYYRHFAAFLGDRAFALRAVRLLPLLLRSAPPALRDDREVVLAAVGTLGCALHFASRRLRRDPEVARAALLGHRPGASGYTSLPPALRRDAALAREWASACPDCWRELETENPAFEDIARRDLAARPHLLPHLGRHRQTRELVLAAVAADGNVLWAARPRFRRDRALVLVAVRSAPLALRHAAPELRADDEVCREAAARDPAATRYAHPELLARALLRQRGAQAA
jgi:hypothetical protein